MEAFAHAPIFLGYPAPFPNTNKPNLPTPSMDTSTNLDLSPGNISPLSNIIFLSANTKNRSGIESFPMSSTPASAEKRTPFLSSKKAITLVDSKPIPFLYIVPAIVIGFPFWLTLATTD